MFGTISCARRPTSLMETWRSSRRHFRKKRPLYLSADVSHNPPKYLCQRWFCCGCRRADPPLPSSLLEAGELLGRLWGTCSPMHLHGACPWLTKALLQQPQGELNWGTHPNWHSRILFFLILWSALAPREEGYVLERAGDTQTSCVNE